MKYKNLGLIALVYSGVLSAGTMGDIEDSRHWSIAGKALYFKPVGAVQNLPQIHLTSLTSGNNVYTGSQFPYSWGVNIDAIYNLDAKYDVGVNWYNLTSSTSFVTQKFSPMHANFALLGSATINSVDIQSESSADWNAVNLEFGRKTTLDNILNLRIHAGGQYARIKTTNTFKSVADVSIDTVIFSANNVPANANGGYKSTINAFGPRIGIDLSRKLAYRNYVTGFDIYAKGATSVLAGPNNFKGNTLVLNNPIINASSSNTSVIPEFEGKIGVNYDHSMNNGTLSFDAGWMWLSYLNLNSNNQVYVNSNFSLEGLYFGLRWLA
jgi:hypothetical protein